MPYVDRYLDGRIEKQVQRALLSQYVVFGDRSRLQIADTAVVNNALFNLSSGRVIVEDYAFFGHNVSILTGTHDYRKFGKERQAAVPRSGRDVIVRRGAWIASGAIVLGPAVIGEHAVIAAGSVVETDVPPYAIAAGTPARIVNRIDERAAIDAEQEARSWPPSTPPARGRGRDQSL
jgi:acetyltransferase-like isoleucine patch superfamily enzyme